MRVCLDGKGELYPCGMVAKEALGISADLQSGFAKSGDWRCELQPEPDRYGRCLGTCFVGGTDINAEMVSSGYALSYRRYGLWAGSFYAPWDFRHHTCSTKIMGAVSVPIQARDKLCGSATP